MTDIRKLTLFSLALGVVAAALSTIAFVIYVGEAASFQISHSASDWALFGDYFGGFLGTIFSGLAFVAILLTLQLQQRQISQLKDQEKFKEIQNCIATLANSIDQTLGRDVAVNHLNIKGSENFMKLLLVVGAMGKELPHNKKDHELFEIASSALKNNFSLFVKSLDTYASMLHFYEQRGGDLDILIIYVARFELVAELVHSAHPHMGIGLSDNAYRVFALAT